VHVAGKTAGDCCSACDLAPSNCSHWSYEAGQCTLWGGANCKRVQTKGATSAKGAAAPPGPPPPTPPTPGAMPVYHQMLWDADLYIGRLVALVKQRDMWENSVWIYSADNGGTGDGINWPLRG
jgi:arylsulfatase A-like enzyme